MDQNYDVISIGRGVIYCTTCAGMLCCGKMDTAVRGNEETKQDADYLRGIG